MLRSLARPKLVAATALALLLLVGCGGAKSVTVNGKLVMPKDVKLAETDSIVVTFTPEDAAKGKGATATVSPNELTFSLNAIPGQYKVAVAVQAYAGEKGSEKRSEMLANKLGKYDAANTGLRHEVTSDDPQTVTIDLAAGTVAK